MPTLHVDLREGFNGESVILRLNGAEVERRDDVRTNYSVGLAGRLELEVPDGEIEIEVEVPQRQVSSRIRHRVSGPVTMAFAMDPGGELTGRTVDASPRYL